MEFEFAPLHPRTLGGVLALTEVLSSGVSFALPNTK